MENNKIFKNGSEEVKYFVKELLEDKKPHDVLEIKSYVERESRKSFTAGQYAGILHRLIKDYEYMMINHGCYIKSNISIDVEQVCNKILSDALKKVVNELKAVNIIDISIEDFNKIQNIKETIELIKDRI